MNTHDTLRSAKLPPVPDISIYVEAATSPFGPWTVMGSSINGAPTTGPGLVEETNAEDGLVTDQVRDTATVSCPPAGFLHIRVAD